MLCKEVHCTDGTESRMFEAAASPIKSNWKLRIWSAFSQICKDYGIPLVGDRRLFTCCESEYGMQLLKLDMQNWKVIKT